MEYSCDEIETSKLLQSEYLMNNILKRYKNAGPGLDKLFNDIIENNLYKYNFCRSFTVYDIQQSYKELIMLGIERQSKTPRVFFDNNKSGGTAGLYLQLRHRPESYIYDSGQKRGIFIIDSFSSIINISDWLL